MLRWRSLAVDLDSGSVQADGAPLRVGPGEAGLLGVLLRRRNLPVTKDTILLELFGPAHGRDSRQADVFVARLRLALRAAGLEEAVVAVPGRGYAVLDDSDDLLEADGGPRADCSLLAA